MPFARAAAVAAVAMAYAATSSFAQLQSAALACETERVLCAGSTMAQTDSPLLCGCWTAAWSCLRDSGVGYPASWLESCLSSCGDEDGCTPPLHQFAASSAPARRLAAWGGAIAVLATAAAAAGGAHSWS